jgi:hypothetical protein
MKILLLIGWAVIIAVVLYGVSLYLDKDRE